jgi:hypothetical protein
LRTDELRFRVENQSYVARMMRRLANVDAHVAAGSGELLHGLAVLKFFGEYEDRTAKDVEVVWADGVGFVGEKLARTFGLSASWRVIVDASSMRDRVWPKGWRDHRWPVSHGV